MTFQHVTIRVRDVEKSIRFYEDVVGLSVTRRLPGGPVFLAAEEGGCSVELIEAESTTAYTGSGISLGFHTGDVEARRAALAEQGLDPSPITSPNPHVKFFFVRDPDGVQIQFI